MILDTNRFVDINSFIENLKKKDEVVGIVEYGGRTHSDMSNGGDYDLTVILDKPISHNFTGVHFHIAGIPIDCMILSVDDFMTDFPANDFLLVHLNCSILHDKDNITRDILERVKTAWKALEYLSECEKNTFRFTFQHVIDKLKNRLHDNELYSRYFIHSSFDWFLQCYSRIKGLEVGKPKIQLAYIKNNDPGLYSIISEMYSANDLDIQFERLKECANQMLETIGGLWRSDEILFHLVPNGKEQSIEQEDVIRLLFE